ncbi:AraC family transcriptional regulator [Paracoccus sp. IB05]|uniref:AraC family transcriptional regulator n=1 Tax=Paracoccus sp. IB05 TaxID=2779367 RepID=UPI0018E8309C|nr:AraC family transcriptional regulator [Paracoccus sp. IB05]MBJ2149818.1 AraC family transcriptional regulator ligand-binding domain-containing protein [Paracoccus sp. IB05]
MNRDTSDRCRLPQAFWRAAERFGLPAPALLRQAQLPAALHVTPDAWLTTAQYFALWHAVEALSNDPAIGLRMTVETDTSVHPPATMSAFFARDYRDGLGRLARFKRLCTPEELTLADSSAECRIALRWLFSSEGEPDAAADVTFAAILELGRRGTGRQIRPLRVEMTRSSPPSPMHHSYFDAPIRTGCAGNALVLRSSDLDLLFAGHNPDLLAILDPSLTASLGEIEAQSSLPEQVKILIKRRIASGKPEIGDVARELGMSERTLQRRITQHGASYRSLLDEARRELGRVLLADGQNGIDEVAFLLGFQDTSSFYRAFRGWEGVTPAAWRNMN